MKPYEPVFELCECKRCGRGFWAQKGTRGWCDDCRQANRVERARRKNKRREKAGQLRLNLE